MRYDYLIVGSGLYGATFAYLATQMGKRCLVIEKRDKIGGNIATETVNGEIVVHSYGAHIFHTDKKEIWDFVNSITPFNHFINSPIANYKGEIFNLPFNMNTFYQMWGAVTPFDAKESIERTKYKGIVTNLEEQAKSLVGEDIFNILIKGYTEKQWGRKCKDLPPSIIKRLPLRFTYNNNYFNDKYQGIPKEGYTKLIEGLLKGSDVWLSCDYFKNREELNDKADKIVYTGPIDQYFDYCYGHLEYRSLTFEHERIETENFQGNAVVNYTDKETPYTRIIEHKHFNTDSESEIPYTIITKEYPCEWDTSKEPYYPISDANNTMLYKRYRKLADKEENVIFGGRLAEYKYYDMDDIIEEVFKRLRIEAIVGVFDTKKNLV